MPRTYSFGPLHRPASSARPRNARIGSREGTVQKCGASEDSFQSAPHRVLFRYRAVLFILGLFEKFVRIRFVMPSVPSSEPTPNGPGILTGVFATRRTACSSYNLYDRRFNARGQFGSSSGANSNKA